MTKIDYDEIAKTSHEAIVEAGTVGLLIKAGQSTGDEWNPVLGNPTEHEVNVVVTDYSTQEVDGTLISTKDKKVLMSARSVEPASGDRMKIGTDVYEVIRFKSIKPADVTILYEVQVRS